MQFKNLSQSSPETGTPKKSFRLPKTGWKFKTAFVISTVVLLIAGAVQTVIAIGTFFDTHKIVRHAVIELKINPPFTIEQREMISPIVPEATKSAELEKETSFTLVETVQASEPVETSASGEDFETIAAFIRWRESSNGKPTNDPTALHNKCAKKGMTNEYGYNPQAEFCFPNEEAAQAKIISWFESKTETMPLSTALCFYNTGNKLSDCQYYQDYLAFTLK